MLLSFSSEPPLKPNHPNQSMNIPSVAKGILQPGIGLSIRPRCTYLIADQEVRRLQEPPPRRTYELFPILQNRQTCVREEPAAPAPATLNR